jgi:GNAT superfamily N-acetyltransferase
MTPAPGVRVAACGSEMAEVVHRLSQAAFRNQRRLDPPSGVGREDLERVVADLAAHGGAVAWRGDAAVGCLRLEWLPDRVHVRRVAVPPEHQRRGIGAALMEWAESEARRRGRRLAAVEVRLALPDNVAFYRRLGYHPFAEHAHPGYDHPTSLELRKALGAGPG